MAGDWIKMRTGLRRDVRVFTMARKLGVSADELLASLYELAEWFAGHGKYGKLEIQASLIDSFAGIKGLASALMEIDWLRDHDGMLCLHWFCGVSAARKSLGTKVRREVLDGAVCACCGCAGPLVIDHIIPIVRGGSCDLSNLQPLCWKCNARKGRRTMDEFMEAIAP